MDITPIIPRDQNVIQGYGDGYFNINGEHYLGDHFVFPKQIIPWTYEPDKHLTEVALSPVWSYDPQLEILLVGCGTSFKPLPLELKKLCISHHIAVETMDSGAACRTYNILLAEGRQVGAALLTI